MDHFKSLFGIAREAVRETVVLLPFVPPGVLDQLGVARLDSGALFASASSSTLTVIRTGAGASFIGDATLYLSGTAARRVILLGSCGLINKKLGLGLGDLVVPATAYAMESFSDILMDRTSPPAAIHPAPLLLDSLSPFSPRLCCVSFGSLYLEEQHLSTFKKLGADIIDMECAALFHAAQRINKDAAAILFISDIPGERPFYAFPSPADKKSLANGISQACLSIKTGRA